MATSTTNTAQLGAFVGLAGGSLSSAQHQLGQGVDLNSTMVMSEAVLEIKAAIGRSGSGELLVEPLSTAQLAGQLNAAAISTLRLNFVATASEVPALASTSPAPTGSTGTVQLPPRMTRDQALAAFQAQADVQRLEQLIGPFALRTELVPSTGHWLVQASDPAGRIVREQLIRPGG
jgi:hypothetical protein